MKVILKYEINPFFKFIITKTQLIICYYHIILREPLNLYFHLQKIQTPPTKNNFLDSQMEFSQKDLSTASNQTTLRNCYYLRLKISAAVDIRA